MIVKVNDNGSWCHLSSLLHDNMYIAYTYTKDIVNLPLRILLQVSTLRNGFLPLELLLIVSNIRVIQYKLYNSGMI